MTVILLAFGLTGALMWGSWRLAVRLIDGST
jgi:hypothetical protein